MKIEALFDRKGMWVYPWYISDMTATADLKEIAGMNVAKTFITIKDNVCTIHYDTDSAGEVGVSLLEKILSDRTFFENVVKNIYRYAEELLDFCRKQQGKDLKKLGDEELLEIYEEYTNKLRKLRTWGWVPVFMDGLAEPFFSNYLLEKLRTFLESKGLAHKASEYYSILSSSEKQSEVQKEELARLEFLIDGGSKALEAIREKDVPLLESRHPDVMSKLKKHLREFGALTYAYAGPAMTLEYLIGVMKEDLNHDLAARKREIIDHFLNIKKEKEAIISEIGLPEELEYAFGVSAELMFMKDWRKGAYQRSYLLMDPVLGELAERLGFTLKEIKFLTLEEVRQVLLEEKREHYQKLMPTRLEYCCTVTENGQTKVFEGTRCDEIKKELVEMKVKPASDTRELQGLIAYKGKVQGTVKIVLTVEDIPKVNVGDILVSSATNPDLIVAMKKAAAFVTDSGGIISHAAIVSREMQKPCVVGTKIATKVLKDGDLVEVDAEQGVIRKL